MSESPAEWAAKMRKIQISQTNIRISDIKKSIEHALSKKYRTITLADKLDDNLKNALAQEFIFLTNKCYNPHAGYQYCFIILDPRS